MAVHPPLHRALWLALGTALLALGAEWAARQPALGGPSAPHAACRPAIPDPAIGAEAGASIVTRDYRRHPTLGWVPGPRSPHHPRSERIPLDGSPWIALFGDGAVTNSPFLPGGSLPEKLSTSLDLPVVSYAVAGHDLARIVERTTTTLAQQQPPPRTALVGFRADVVEHLASAGRVNEAHTWRSHLLARLQGVDPANETATPCEGTIDRERVVALLGELQAAARAQGTELVVALLPPAAPRPNQRGYRDLLLDILDDLAIHSVSLWQLDDPVAARGQTEQAARVLRERLAHRADYYWGTPIAFGEGGNAERYHLAGFSAGRKHGRWTVEPTAHLEVSPPAHPNGILAEVRFNNAVANDVDDRQLVVRVGEVAVARWPIARLRKRLQETFFLDAGIAAERPLTIRFELASLKSPRETGRGKNPRKLGVLIDSLTLRPDRQSLPGASGAAPAAQSQPRPARPSTARVSGARA